MKLELAAVMVLAMAPMAIASGAAEPKAKGEGVVHLAGGAFTYEVFEAAVEHADLSACPAEFNAEEAFCRLTLASDGAHVFVFALEGAQPLLAVKSYALDDGLLPF